MRRSALAFVASACAALVLAPSPAAAHDTSILPPLPPLPVPLPLSVQVTTADPSGPVPTGRVTVSLNDGTLLTRRLGSTTDMAVIATALALVGQKVTVGYSGDTYYGPSGPVRVVVPSDNTVRIQARPRSSSPPADAAATAATAGSPVAGAAPPAGAPATAGSSVADSSQATPAEPQPATPPPAGPSLAGAAPPAQPPASASNAEPAAPAAEPEPGARSATSRTSSRPGARSRAAARTTGSRHEVATRPVRHELAPYDPRSNPAQTLGLLVATFTLLQLAMRGGGLALAGSGGGVAGTGSHGHAGARGDGRGSSPEPSFDYGGVSVTYLGAGIAAMAIGDRSRTWGWPGTRTVDALGTALPARLARRSPLLARFTADGTYLRAILGSGWLLAPLAGAALGLAALQEVGGEAVPPAATLAIAIAVLGVLDAMAGLAAVLMFGAGVLALGGVDSGAHLRLMLGLGALWCVVPVLAGAVRPLRRKPTRRLEEAWDRAADFVIASLIGAWAVQKIVLSLPGLAGTEVPLTAHANTAAYCVFAALVVRLGLETLSAHLYPWRLDVTEPRELPEPGAVQRLGAAALRTCIFVFFAYIVVGGTWQLWVGAALFVIPQILAVYEERVPNSPGLFRALPKGLAELVFMLLVGSAVGTLLISTMDEQAETFIANSFVLLSLPGFVLALLALFGRDGDAPRIGWGKRIGGVGLLALGIAVALGLLL